MSKITIDKKRYAELLDTERKMDALEAGGVDNWEWYGESLKSYWEYKETEEKAAEIAESVFEILGSGAYEPSERGAGVAFSDDAMEQVRSLIMSLTTTAHSG